MQIFVKTLT
nr:hypothetical protein [Tanacetum cinerariifolium]